MKFANRTAAGRILATRLKAYADDSGLIVLALPRGGVPVAYEVARALHAPLDVWVVRKLGVPGHEELAMGAAASGGVEVSNYDVVRSLRITKETFDAVVQQERQEIERRERVYRNNQPPPHVEGRTVVFIDDGLATGATMRVAVRSVRLLRPAHVAVAVPTASRSAYDEMRAEADEVVCVVTSDAFDAVGLWYEDFPQITDEEVCTLLQRSRIDPVE